jgi:hypothetical protein
MLFLQRNILDFRVGTGIFLLINDDVSMKNYINSICTEFCTSSKNDTECIFLLLFIHLEQVKNRSHAGYTVR